MYDKEVDMKEIDRDTLKVSEITTVPPWIDSDITVRDVESILQGGCASGAYMPAVTYHEATETMAEHGDTVLDFITEDHGLDLNLPDNPSWSGLACHFLSVAVELWCSSVETEIEDYIEEKENEEEEIEASP